MKTKELVREVRFKATIGSHEIDGIVINPGSWFGKVWLIQIAIANALNPWFAVEAGSEQDAIDELADSERFSHYIDVPEDDEPKWIPKDPEDPQSEGNYEETDFCQAGNDGHWVDLTNVHMQAAPNDLKYVVEWNPEQDGLSSVIDQELNTVREENPVE
jgi:hypothetical protein